MNKPIIYSALFFLIISCGVKVKNVDFAKSPENTKELISRVMSTNKTPEWLLLKGKVELKDQENDLVLSINIKCRKDSLVRFSLSAPFGIELFRATITKDSIYFINHTNKTFFIRPNTYISTFLKTDISFYDIQEIITANPRVLKKKYKLDFGKNTFELKNKQVFYIISADFYRILSSSTIDGEREFFYEFGSYAKQNDFVFPKNLLIRFNSPSESFEAKLSYSKVVFNQQQNLSFKIPGSYVELE